MKKLQKAFPGNVFISLYLYLSITHQLKDVGSYTPIHFKLIKDTRVQFDFISMILQFYVKRFCCIREELEKLFGPSVNNALQGFSVRDK